MTTKFDLDAAVVEAKGAPPFQFMFDGRDYQLPNVRTLNVQSLERLDSGPDGMHEVLAADAPDVAALARTLPSGALEQLIQAWIAHSGTTPGESSASPASSNGTAGR